MACLVPILIQHGWTKPSDLSSRIVGHDEQAIWTPAYTRDAKLWGKLGRKVDPTGTRSDKKPIIDVAAIRKRLSS